MHTADILLRHSAEQIAIKKNVRDVRDQLRSQKTLLRVTLWLTLHSRHLLPVPYGVPRFFALNSLFSPIARVLDVDA